MASSTATSTTVFVRFLPPSVSIRRHHLENVFSQIGPIKKSSVIVKAKGPSKQLLGGREEADETTAPAIPAVSSYGFIRFTTESDAERAASQLNHSIMRLSDSETVRIRVERASRTLPSVSSSSPTTSSRAPEGIETQEDGHAIDQQRKKNNRLIIRNLSFYAKKSHIKQALEQQFGPLVDIHIPSVLTSSASTTSSRSSSGDGFKTTHRGFCFVTFEHARHAQACLDFVNGRSDKRESPSNKEVLLIANRPVSIARALNKTAFELEKEKNTSVSNERSKEGADEEANDDRGKDGVVIGQEEDDGVGDEGSISASSTSDSDTDSYTDEASSSNEGGGCHRPLRDTTAVKEGRTVFLRNLPFDATRHDVFQLLYKFGYITGIYLVKDRETRIFKGTAFVSFRDSQSVERVLKQVKQKAKETNDRDEKIEHSRDSAPATLKQRGVGGGCSGGNDDNGDLVLSGRRIFVNIAVDKETAFSLSVDVKNSSNAQLDAMKTAGEPNSTKDRRNLYLKGEGRVDNRTDERGTTISSAWDELPESDKLKRQRAWSEKNSKLRSPLFFINPTRLSVRNLSKDVTEVGLKKMCVQALLRGLENRLVTAQDQIAHWKAAGDVSSRDILKRSEAMSDDDDVIPAFEARNVGKYIQSVFIDCDFPTRNNKKNKVSRGFGFVEFEHHAHALACLRELNNNTRYTEEYASGGKHAVMTRLREQRSRSKNKRKMAGGTDGGKSGDNKVKLPRLIVEFTVENIAKAKQQAQNRALQRANTIKQKRECRGSDIRTNKKKSRGQRQREKKRLHKQSRSERSDTDLIAGGVSPSKPGAEDNQQQSIGPKWDDIRIESKTVNPCKRRKVDKDDEEFSRMVASYKSSFASDNSSSVANNQDIRHLQTKRRWFE